MPPPEGGSSPQAAAPSLALGGSAIEKHRPRPERLACPLRRRSGYQRLTGHAVRSGSDPGSAACFGRRLARPSAGAPRRRGGLCPLPHQLTRVNPLRGSGLRPLTRLTVVGRSLGVPGCPRRGSGRTLRARRCVGVGGRPTGGQAAGLRGVRPAVLRAAVLRVRAATSSRVRSQDARERPAVPVDSTFAVFTTLRGGTANGHYAHRPPISEEGLSASARSRTTSRAGSSP